MCLDYLLTLVLYILFKQTFPLYLFFFSNRAVKEECNSVNSASFTPIKRSLKDMDWSDNTTRE